MKDAEPSRSNLPIPVIDLFAGPGGLNEGFSSIGEDEDKPIFRTVGSFEMESNAVSTLTLRSAYRSLKRSGRVPQAYYDYISGKTSRQTFEEHEEVAVALAEARQHVHRVELGKKTRDEVDAKIASALEAVRADEQGDWILIGGPPCQAYSLAGRSRRTNDVQFAFDHKHFLYEEYLHIIERFRPAVFVMENVKGLLSSTNNGVGMFSQILHDLRHPNPDLRYEIRSLVVDEEPHKLRPRDFVIPAEKYGIPQKRHRIILLGIRSDVVERTDRTVLEEASPVTVRDAVGDLPRCRSRISPAKLDSDEAWVALRNEAVAMRYESVEDTKSEDFTVIKDAHEVNTAVKTYREWVEDSRVTSPLQHKSRSHMGTDIQRYAHLAWKAETLGKSPKFTDLPEDLLPNHKNIGKDNTPFMDRFRVQVWDSPSTTIVSHISKDGHYYIHPDETQMRSLTVREAARLQTFPDNYFFEGSRTMQFHQVGNAVPPLLARFIAEKVVETLRLNIDKDVSGS
ncbi:DNA cytosine methyltransferase [Pseudarthrobacter sp. RMG13]|uniref:DNA (cytosine-5-)-methyltransferase n=1 Tax=Pseudarthrobacter humi TaxID=2952523 RepID=A0ABT1LPG6_9MICC|nr:DNA cytosine methyltransferase [Pseudarthrobacter humi]MCP9000352.1 DNA cytosine methyltransferase [Pseudarthrobacter humi]